MAALKSLEELFFSIPPYSEREFAVDDAVVQRLFDYQKGFRTVDGYCPHCALDRVFAFPVIVLADNISAELEFMRRTYTIRLRCSKDGDHVIDFWIRLADLKIQKVGQWPSHTTIGISELRSKYKNVLKGDNWTELYRAVGLASHEEGIGSFVYMRRVFERLIFSRFSQVKVTEGWDDDFFNTLRMDEKIDLLKNYLPNMLVESRKIYGIFSAGIHELENKRCLDFFPVGKESIIAILEEDLRSQQDKERKALLQKEIARFDPKA